jgi:hypothetical protein
MSGVTDLLPKDEKILVSAAEMEDPLQRFRRDLDFLARLAAVNYSLLLVRRPDGTARLALIDCFWNLHEPGKADHVCEQYYAPAAADGDGGRRGVRGSARDGGGWGQSPRGMRGAASDEEACLVDRGMSTEQSGA